MKQQDKTTPTISDKIQKKQKAVTIKYDVITPEERDPNPKDFDEIEY